MKKIYHLLIFFSVILLLANCNIYNPPQPDTVELFLIDTYQTNDSSYQIIENSVITNDTPLILYKDFLSYDSS